MKCTYALTDYNGLLGINTKNLSLQFILLKICKQLKAIKTE